MRQQVRSGRPVNGAVHTATPKQRFVRGVDDGVDREVGDIVLCSRNLHKPWVGETVDKPESISGSSPLSWPTFETPWVSAWQPEKVGTPMFVRAADEILLIHKKTGHGRGLVNGPGGKLEPGEDPRTCAIRETAEETGVHPLTQALSCQVEMRFVELDGPQWLGFAFLAGAWQGTMRETEEARPFWCSIDDIPYDNMWPDDSLWLPRLLNEEGSEAPLVGNFLFKRGELLAHEFVSEESVWQDIRG